MEAVITFLRGIFPDQLQNRLFLVGGIVRDFLTGKTGQDIDLVAALPAAELLSRGFRPVMAKSAAPIYFRYHPTFGKIEVTVLADLAGLPDNLVGRDFTINALAMAFSGEVIDPLGGRADLAKKRLRACSARSFTNDPIRIFRALRFEAEGWRMAPETVALLGEHDWSAALLATPVERFSQEMLKTLEKDDPAWFFQQMLALSVGKEFLPELFRMPQIPAGPLEHHPEGDLFTHSLQVLQRVAGTTPDPVTRFCALFHDLGKLATDPALYPTHHGHDIAGFELARNFCNRLCLPALLRKALSWTNRLHGTANRWEELRDSTRIRLADQALKAGIANILPLVSAADMASGRIMVGWDKVLEVMALTTTELGIDPRLFAVADPRGDISPLPPEKRSELIMQKRVEALRSQR
jgi:tRNA nucleotidyltransferase (CCA-adding enzyme)